MSVQILKDKLPDILTHFQALSLVYLFGSQATEHAAPVSDYDLGVLIDRGANQDQIQAEFRHELACVLDTDRIDVVVLNSAPVELAYAVIVQRERLYERDVFTRVEFEADTMSRYGDYLPFLRALRKDMLREDKDGIRVRRSRAALRRTERTLGQIMAPQRENTNRI